MREPLACRSASAKNAVACRGLRVGPSKFKLGTTKETKITFVAHLGLNFEPHLGWLKVA